MQPFAARQASKAAKESSTVQSTLRYHISTHFELGSHIDKYVKNSNNRHCVNFAFFFSPASETSQSFQGDGDYSNPDYLMNQTDKNRSKSHVFREGDYNMDSPNTAGHFVSTQKKDYVHNGADKNVPDKADGTKYLHTACCSSDI